MKTQSFKLFELLQLEAELAGVLDQKTGERILEGLLSQKLSLTTKYWLNGLVETLGTEKKAIDALRDELIKKHGDEDSNGNIGISMYVETGEKDADGNALSAINPKYAEFNAEYSALLNESKDIKVPQIKLSELDKIETEENYSLVLKYLVTLPVEETTVEEVK
jgi:hypothetical protein